MNLLCKLGLHRPLTNHRSNFTDVVSGKTVFDATCPCGKVFMVDSPQGWFGCKMEKESQKAKEQP